MTIFEASRWAKKSNFTRKRDHVRLFSGAKLDFLARELSKIKPQLLSNFFDQKPLALFLTGERVEQQKNSGYEVILDR